MKSLRLSLVRTAAEELNRSLKNTSRHIGRARLFHILNYVQDQYAKNLNTKDLQVFAHPENVTSHYIKWNRSFNFNAIPPKEQERLLRSSIYQASNIFKALRYSSTVTKSKVANELLLSVFNEEVIANVALALSSKFSIVSKLVNNNTANLYPIAKKVYINRRKFVTGQTLRMLRTRAVSFKDGNTDGVVLEMYNETDPLYSRRMDIGTFNKNEVPTTGELYGWIKRREAVGLWDKLEVKGWRWRNHADNAYEHKTPRDMKMAPGMAAFIIHSRMMRTFQKTGRLAPFGSFSKYRSRKVYSTSIFSEIFDQYIEHIVKKSTAYGDNEQFGNRQAKNRNALLDVRIFVDNAVSASSTKLPWVNNDMLVRKINLAIANSGLKRSYIDAYLKSSSGKTINQFVKQILGNK